MRKTQIPGSNERQCNSSAPRMESHMTFICPECGIEFESQQDWRRHLNGEHDYLHKTPKDFDFVEINENFHECQVCHKWVANANKAIGLLQYHRFLHLPFNRTYRCRHCKAGFTRKRALCEHLYRHHSQQIVEMEQQRQMYSSSATASGDQSAVRDPKRNPEFYIRFTCPLCGRDIDRFEQWLEHLNTHQTTSTELRMHRISGSRNHYCLQCKKLLYTTEKEKLQRHHFLHLPFRNYFKCAFCLVKKAFKAEIFRHFVYAHPRKFLEAKEYIQKPTEWGGKISDRLNKELEMMLKPSASEVSPVVKSRRRPNKDVKTVVGETKPIVDYENSYRSANDVALDKSLKEFEDVLKLEKSTSAINSLKTDKPEEDDDLADTDDFIALCTEMFENFDPNPTDHHPNQTAINKVKENDESEEQIISIEIDKLGINCEAVTEKEPVTKTPPQKRIKLGEDVVWQHKSSVHNKDTKLSEEQRNNLLETHILYICPECGNEFSNSSNWRNHVFTEHNLENAIQSSFQLLENNCSYLCLDCMTVQNTTKTSDLQRHHFMHMPYQSYLKCKLCSKRKSSKPKMLDHLKQFHSSIYEQKNTNVPSKLLPCHECGNRFANEDFLRFHRSNCGQKIIGAGKIMNNNGDDNVGFNNLALNMKLLDHLKGAERRLDRINANENLKLSQTSSTTNSYDNVN